MKQTYTIYALQSPSGKLYVGQTKSYESRMKRHKRKDSECVAIKDAINKYGWNKMKQHILLKGLSLEQANHWEQHYIKIFDCMVPNGYNLTSGGSNCIISDETKKKMSISHKGKNIGKKRPPRTAEWCNNHSKSMTGKVRTAEHCSNISKAKKGKKRKPFTAEHRSNISKGLTGKKQPNVSKAMTGKKRKPFTAEHKSNMSLVQCR